MPGKFSIRGYKLTNWVLETTAEPFHKILSLRRVAISWSRSKIVEHLNAMQCYKCSLYGYKCQPCKNREMYVWNAEAKNAKQINVKRQVVKSIVQIVGK